MKFVMALCQLLITIPALAGNAISLDGVIPFNGNCANISIQGVAAGNIGTYFHPIDTVISFKEKTIIDTEKMNLAIPIEHMSLNCVGVEKKQKLVVAVDCLAHAEVCTKTWFYIIDAQNGNVLAPKNMKSQNALCDAQCADKIIGNSFATILEDERHR